MHLVGFDVMLDEEGHCHLLEINCRSLFPLY